MIEKCHMQDHELVEKIEKQNKSSAPRGGPPAKRLIFSFEQKLRAVKLHLEEGFPQELVARELGISNAAVYKWTKRYRDQGEEGLKSSFCPESRAKLAEAVRKKIIQLKQEEPARGIKRISQLLRRVFFLQASPPTVRKTLQSEGLMKEARPKPPRNLGGTRFLERPPPNGCCQTDFLTFRLGARYAYFIAFMDDYSRFIVGADLFRSHTAENVLEVFRVAAGEYQPPKEMLTDNGREYVNWRGTTRFQAEMKKNGTHHFKSRPHHPMTLGKIERFWETLWQEFLCRAQFESFESARERIRIWIRYYNHKRPHQGIEGLCPADRFFEIASELRKTIEAGIKENLLELALRGQPKAPFYMVGRMEGQSVILRAEKGKLKLSIDNGNENKELTYDLKQSQAQNATNPSTQLLRPGESSSGTLSVDGTSQRLGGLPATAPQLDHASTMAGASHGGNAPGPGTACQPGPGSGPEPTAPGAAGQAPPAAPPAQTGGATRADSACQGAGDSGTKPVDDSLRKTSEPDSTSPSGPAHGPGSRPPTGHLPPGLLQVGAAWPGSPAQGPAGPASGPAQGDNRPAEGPTPEPGGGTGTPSPAL